MLLIASLVVWQWVNHEADASSDFVRKWQLAQPRPSSETISELRVLAAKLQNEPKQAEAISVQITQDPSWLDLVDLLNGWPSNSLTESEASPIAALVVMLPIGVLLFVPFMKG